MGSPLEIRSPSRERRRGTCRGRSQVVSGDETLGEEKNVFKYLAIAATLAITPAAFALQADSPDAQTQAGQAGETSDRTPDKTTQTPQNQEDTAGGKTSDRSQDKDVKVEHQPGAPGSAGSRASEGASSGTSGSSTTTPPADAPASSGSGNQ